MRKLSISLIVAAAALPHVGCGSDVTATTPPDLGMAVVVPPDAALSPGGRVLAAAAGAPALRFGAAASTTVDTTVGHRFFSIQAKAGDGIHLDVGGATIDTVITLYDAQGTRVGRNDSEFPDGRGPQSCFLHRFATDGTYYVDISEVSIQDDVTRAADSDYDVQYGAQRFRPSSPLMGISHDAEGGDDIASAVEWVSPQLGANGFLYGSFRDAKDVDVFRVDLPANASFAVFAMNGTTEGAGGTAEVHIRLADKDGKTLAESNAAAGFDAQQVGPVRGVGTVYMWLTRGPSTGANDMYALKPLLY